jgi:Mg-chelatase subunit ChlD
MEADFAGRGLEESLSSSLSSVSASPEGPNPNVSIQAQFDDLSAYLVPKLEIPSQTDSPAIAIDGALPAFNLKSETQAAASREVRDFFERGEEVQRDTAPVTRIPATPSPEQVNRFSRRDRQELPQSRERPTVTVPPAEPGANSVALRDVQLEAAPEEPSQRISEIIADRYGLTQTRPNEFGIGQNASSPPKSPTIQLEQRLERMEELRQIEEAETSARRLGRTTAQSDELARDKEENPTTGSLIAKVEGKIEELSKLQEAETRAVAGLSVNGNDQNLGELAAKDVDMAAARPTPSALVPQPEVRTAANPFSTFSLNVSDVSFKLAAASVEQGVLPDPASIRGEEFLNAFDYRDPDPAPGSPVAFAWERARSPFAHNRDLLRFSVKTGSIGREAGRPLNVVLLLDNSGSMERADRVRIIREALGVLAGQLQPRDRFSLVAFARTPRLWVDGVAGNEAHDVAGRVGSLTPEGGTNLEEALAVAYATALRHYLPEGINRVVLLTDGAANLGNVEPETLKQTVEAHRQQGVALDCFGVGWEGYNDDLLEVLSRNGDGRYGFINTPEEVATGFAGQLAGALQVAAADVKVQVEFNPRRVTAHRQIGYARHQLTREQFRDNTVDAAEIGAAESGNALYVTEVDPNGQGSLAVVRVRFKVPGTAEYREQEWVVPYIGQAVPLEQAGPAMRLAATAAAFSEWLASSPHAGDVSPDRLLGILSGVPEVYGADERPAKLEWMIRQARSLAGN